MITWHNRCPPGIHRPVGIQARSSGSNRKAG